ncbi:MAG: CPBP family glutamic-type intramembrane protease [Chloroflexota bacterium]
MPLLTFNQWVGLLSEALGVVAVTMLLGISPRIRSVAPLGFRYPRREGWVALGLAAALLGLSTLIYLQPGVAGEVARGGTESLYPALTLAVAAAALSAAALAYRRQPLRSAGWNRALLTPAVQVGIAVTLLSIFLRGMLARLLAGVSAEQAQALLLLAVIALAEETAFRGYIQPRLSAWLGAIPGWLLTSLLFTAFYLPRALALPPEVQLTALGVALGHGLLAGWMMLKIRHALAAALYRAVSGWLLLLLV